MSCNTLPTAGSPLSHIGPLLVCLITARYFSDSTSARGTGSFGPLPSSCTSRLTKKILSPGLMPFLAKLTMMSKRSAMPWVGRMALWFCLSPSASRSMVPSNGTLCSMMLPSLAIMWNGTRA
ncbi:hypothetical protein D3C76_1075740 [compost metagenome]